MYDRTDGGKRARDRIMVSLGLWHNYKQANMLLFGRLADSWFAGCFHALFPNKAFYPRPRHLSAIVTLFTYVRLAYPSIKHQLEQSLSRDDLPNAHRNMLLNLQVTCEFFIPVVRIILVRCLHCASFSWNNVLHEYIQTSRYLCSITNYIS